MSYRSLKRVLGETNLERKCRFLFGTCLLLLIMGSFTWYGQSTEQLVHEKNEATGRLLVDAVLLKIHWQNNEKTSQPGYDAYVAETGLNLEYINYDWEILVRDPEAQKLARTLNKEERISLPANEEEYQVLAELQYEQETRDKEILERFLATPELETKVVDEEWVKFKPQTDDKNLVEYSPVSRSSYNDSSKTYVYYQPIYWKYSCTLCHNNDVAAAFPAGQPATEDRLPFTVVKITKPDDVTQLALNKNFAFLVATGIITVALSMAALYLIVKYVIVKPLNHLREVSEEVTNGNTSVRADIRTNDEFEDLASSFNKMLRHLIDAQNQLHLANDDLDNKVDELARVNVQLYEMNRVKSDFLANMSHELRTPLNSILGFSDVLSGIDSLNDKQKRYVQNIQKSGRLLLDMINDILDLAKIESGRMEVRPSEFSVAAVVRANCDMVRSLIEEKNLDLECDVQDGGEPMFQDQTKLQQILTNLLSNAIKFTPEGGRIIVRVSREEDMMKLSVQDTGVGIAEEDREVIFEKFRQGAVSPRNDSLTREFSGTGLGLSIVMEICKLLDGSVDLESQLGSGSTFTIRIPWIADEGPDLSQSTFRSKLNDLSKSSGEFPRLGGPGSSNGSPTDAAAPSQRSLT
ncbi:HAMP domain-containing histidine kinase [Blastopirellula sp. JC732]|uniref:histidine kinase n=1 Tax=Blastopirellula sediminis TaxID=2894196 RepID=A0A9X1MQX1_9BACT|nr:HAMP domain-containing sensor histidine kinase [Blastopirellula sediminis]MCC9604838.1 HAMP domain-containing histidine kinase [Blastopirellula sediminis]MCC9631863.1 HAMP domain-containing histidine kinase [Blastopirellula sediminis]